MCSHWFSIRRVDPPQHRVLAFCCIPETLHLNGHLWKCLSCCGISAFLFPPGYAKMHLRCLKSVWHFLEGPVSAWDLCSSCHTGSTSIISINPYLVQKPFFHIRLKCNKAVFKSRVQVDGSVQNQLLLHHHCPAWYFLWLNLSFPHQVENHCLHLRDKTVSFTSVVRQETVVFLKGLLWMSLKWQCLYL